MTGRIEQYYTVYTTCMHYYSRRDKPAFDTLPDRTGMTSGSTSADGHRQAGHHLALRCRRALPLLRTGGLVGSCRKEEELRLERGVDSHRCRFSCPTRLTRSPTPTVYPHSQRCCIPPAVSAFPPAFEPTSLLRHPRPPSPSAASSRWPWRASCLAVSIPGSSVNHTTCAAAFSTACLFLPSVDLWPLVAYLPSRNFVTRRPLSRPSCDRAEPVSRPSHHRLHGTRRNRNLIHSPPPRPGRALRPALSRMILDAVCQQ